MEQLSQSATMWDALRIWWAWFWRVMLVVVGIGFVVGFMLGLFGSLLGLPKESVMKLTLPCGAIIGLCGGIWGLKYVLNKKFSDFKIAIIRD